MLAIKKHTASFLVILFLLVSLPILLVFIEQTSNYLSRATARQANIVIDADTVLGPLPQVWRAIAQGGEDPDRTFFTVRDELEELSPRYVRLDHIYDFYNVANREEGKLTFNWDELDQIIRDIVVSGATPFFSLSYMPLALSADTTIIGQPVDWNEWALLVQKTIEHYSGRSEMNLSAVYYEVWNEPDLFGDWKTYGDKNYLNLYYFAAQGAQQAQSTNRFFFGGPGTTAPYRNWMVQFLKFVTERNLRLDFLSWHRYSTKPDQYRQDLDLVESWIATYTDYNQLPKVISEFAFDSENNPAHDSRVAAAHTVAVVREIIPDIELAFTFELKDGQSPEGKRYWGRWGILAADSFGNEKKPRYFALKLLNELSGKRLAVSGEGDFVKAIASREFNITKVLLVNYDPQDRHAEQVPVSITNVSRSSYKLEQEDIEGNKTSTIKLAENGTIIHEVIMLPNSVILITLVPI